MSRPRITMPADVEQMLAELSDVEIARQTGASRKTVGNWRERLGVPRNPLVKGGSYAAPVPEGFEELQAGKSIKELARILKASPHTVRRWLRATGLYDGRVIECAPRQRHQLTRAPMKSTFIQTATPDRPHIDRSPAGQAAEFLRRFGPVQRCNEQRQYDPAGNYWLRGGFRLNADEIIQRAERLGWTGGRMAA